MKKVFYVLTAAALLTVGIIACSKDQAINEKTSEVLVDTKTPSQSPIQKDNDLIKLEKVRDDFARDLANAGLTREEIISYYENQDYQGLVNAAGIGQRQLDAYNRIIETSSQRLVERHNIDVTGQSNNEVSGVQLANVVEKLQNRNAGGGNDVALIANTDCKWTQYTVCLSLAAVGSAGCGVFAVGCYAAGAYLCVCSYCDVNCN